MKDNVIIVIAAAIAHGPVRCRVNKLKVHDLFVEWPRPFDIGNIDADIPAADIESFPNVPESEVSLFSIDHSSASSRADPEDGLDRHTQRRVGKCLLDLIEVIEAHEAIEGKARGAVLSDHFRYEELRDGVTLNDALQ
jgi:hypothetical protein